MLRSERRFDKYDFKLSMFGKRYIAEGLKKYVYPPLLILSLEEKREDYLILEG